MQRSNLAGGAGLPSITFNGLHFSLTGSDTLDIDGSSTVFPITEAVAEEYGISFKGLPD